MKPKKSKKPKECKSTFLFIGISPYIRERLGSLCVHLPELNFTDSLFKEDCQVFQSALANLTARKWEEVIENEHCHPLDQDEREKLKNYLSFLSDKELNKLLAKSNDVWQISLEKDKFRVYGIKDRRDNKDYFEILLSDPNHLFYPDQVKSKYPYGKEAVCLMDCLGRKRKKECWEKYEEPKDKIFIRS